MIIAIKPLVLHYYSLRFFLTFLFSVFTLNKLINAVSIFVCETDMPLNCTGSSLSVDGTILSNAAETLRSSEKKTLADRQQRLTPTDSTLPVDFSPVNHKKVPHDNDACALSATGFFFYSHRLKIHSPPFLSQMSRFHELGTDILRRFLPVIL